MSVRILNPISIFKSMCWPLSGSIRLCTQYLRDLESSLIQMGKIRLNELHECSGVL
jgi:hypothetical protein